LQPYPAACQNGVLMGLFYGYKNKLIAKDEIIFIVLKYPKLLLLSNWDVDNILENSVLRNCLRKYLRNGKTMLDLTKFRRYISWLRDGYNGPDCGDENVPFL